MAAGTSPDGASEDRAPANDALLVQLVRGALGRALRGWRRINVSSSSFVVTLHGVADSDEERDEIEATARAVPGVRAVTNRVRVSRYSIGSG